jgi:hypothetical protein
MSFWKQSPHQFVKHLLTHFITWYAEVCGKLKIGQPIKNTKKIQD